MSTTKICSSSSTSTTDLHQRQVIFSNSYSQTIPNDHDDDEYANYEEIYLEKPILNLPENIIKKVDQTTLCRVNHYSIACWTKPAYLTK